MVTYLKNATPDRPSLMNTPLLLLVSQARVYYYRDTRDTYRGKLKVQQRGGKISMFCWIIGRGRIFLKTITLQWV